MILDAIKQIVCERRNLKSEEVSVEYHLDGIRICETGRNHTLPGTETVMKESERQRRQLWAYGRRGKIQLGDRFLWRKSDKPEHITSGKLPENYLWVSEKFMSGGIFTVCRVYESHNGYGDFVDYWLTTDYEPGKDYEPKDCIIINGPDAFRMERVTDNDLP